MSSIDGLSRTYPELTSINREVDLLGLQEHLTISYVGVGLSLELRLKQMALTLGPCNLQLCDVSKLLEASQRWFEEVKSIVSNGSDERY